MALLPLLLFADDEMRNENFWCATLRLETITEMKKASQGKNIEEENRHQVFCLMHNKFVSS